jgi:hypothetical protein
MCSIHPVPFAQCGHMGSSRASVSSRALASERLRGLHRRPPGGQGEGRGMTLGIPPVYGIVCVARVQ